MGDYGYSGASSSAQPYSAPKVDAGAVYATETEGGAPAAQPQAPSGGGSSGGATAAGSVGPGFQVDPDGVRGVAARIAQAGVSAAELLIRLRSSLEAAGEPWGTDDLGKQFGHGYTGHVNQGFAAVALLGDALTGIANSLVSGANAHEATEGEVEHAFRSVQQGMDQGRGGGASA